ncbi:hypothetical protein PC9H_008350 [Pleurotus ostreatus]|uniref:DJ-1/PfpI domain-containing protein n=1 Tax=Pleurotus ostreatus TaxID=5322 RepID=A0A8H7DRJ5_PLEOS|nr:uncharacterized protein PC9H_008350 [Pleurotus ostreatus]KAF7425988.1 hypothetical protein PC9H_008350 [Pleurotus ostreatus]
MASSPTTLRLAVCLFDQVTALDYQGPIEILGFLDPNNVKPDVPTPSYLLEITYLARTLEPIKATAGPRALADRTYDEVGDGEQFDLILVPGGQGARPEKVPSSLLEFLKRQAPGAKHVLSVCTGSWILARAGLLQGKKATTNKSVFKAVVENIHGYGIDWIPKARFVVNDDKKIWTSSGVTAGMDMANAFLEYLVGKEAALRIRGIVELSAKEEGDDEFAEYYHLL